MQLQKIEINNFRGIHKAEIEGFKQLNFFIGKNNACKTSVLEAIFLCAGINNPALPIRINRFRHISIFEEDNIRFLFYNLDYQNRPFLTTFFNEKEHRRTLKINPHENVGNINAFQKQKFDETAFDTQLDPPQIDGLILNTTIKERHKRLQEYQSTLVLTDGFFMPTYPKNYKEPLSAIFISPTTEMPNLDKRLEKLIVEKAQQPIVQALKNIDSNIQNISLGTDGMIYFDIGLPRLIPINLAGDGIKRILSLLVTISDNKNSIVLIDEIDNGLHFSSQATLLKALMQAAKSYNVQIFATTHNYETLRKLQEVLADESMETCQNDVKTFTLRKLKDNVVKAYAYDYEALDYILEQSIEIR
ncbi:MAG: AAA family ATPase [Chitinophagales bacterium]